MPPTPVPESEPFEAADAAAGLARLWSDFKARGRREQRDELILTYAPVVKYVAGRMAVGLPPSVDQADLVSYGIFGLIDAIEKFEPERGHKFETYAISRIKGAILDELRATDWVPRSVRAKVRAIERASGALAARLGRAPTEAELAAELSMSVPELARTLGRVSYLGLAALDELIGSEGETATIGDTIADPADGPGASYEVVEMRELVAGAVGTLPEREKVVLTLYYYEGLTLADIGEVIGVTESRVSQIHTKAVLQLRSRLDLGGHAR